jgi:hypothetical protein
MDETPPTNREQACFETGIKFGSLYHQFAGTPVSPASAATLEDAMAEAIENQPHCERVRVDIDTDELATAIEESPASYTELTGRFLDVTVVVGFEDTRITAKMQMQDGYPRMSVVDVDGPQS